jgi:hypothetical protein
MTVTPVNPLVFSSIQPKGETRNTLTEDRSLGSVASKKRPEPQDSLNLSETGLDLARKETRPVVPLPAFGRLRLGGQEPLPFGPNQDANALNRIAGDGVQTTAKGVELGHRPARGLNILA